MHQPAETLVIQLLNNPWRGRGLPATVGLARGTLLRDVDEPLALWTRCPVAATTPLLETPGLAAGLDIARVSIKDERGRMGLGSFKALGASYAIAHDAAQRVGGADRLDDPVVRTSALDGVVYVCASAGNHGLSVAAGARVFGATAEIHLAESVPEAFARRLRRFGARVVRSGTDYESSMQAAETAAREQGATLLSDSSWPGYVEPAARVMQGYLLMAQEILDALADPPTHLFLQAGVGGLAAAVTARLRDHWGEAPCIVVVEPEAAATLMESVRAGRPVRAPGPVSIMGRLDCKEPSHLALAELARNADAFVTISEEEASETVDFLAAAGLPTTPSGAAGVSALHHAGDLRQRLGLTADSHALFILSEGMEETPDHDDTNNGTPAS